MYTEDAWPLTCSVCDRDVVRQSGALTCSAGHTFDIAREGYVNLLAARDSERGITGDTAEMLHARRRFLDSGAYAPLRDAIREEISSALDASSGGSRCVVEAGCGEGYYIGSLADAQPSSTNDVRYIGFDISKAAARLAARRYRNAAFVVANIRRRLYLRSGSAGVVLSICAPRNVDEFRRILGTHGRVHVVIPDTEHLRSLRETYGLLSIEELKEQRIAGQFSGFELVSRRTIEFPLALRADQVRDLVAMGPNAWHNVPGVSDVRALETAAAFVIMTFQRTSDEDAA